VSIRLRGTKFQFCTFWLKNQNKFKRLQNAMKLYKSFLCIFIDVSANNELKIRFIGRDFR